jgi:PKD repeat protein
VNAKGRVGFWNLSHKQTFYGNADQLVGFRLMPLESPRKGPQARWTHTVVDANRRLVAFVDRSIGQVTAWKWDFGDGATSSEQHPQHVYSRGGDFVVTLEVSGSEGTSRFQRVWDVSLR